MTVRLVLAVSAASVVAGTAAALALTAAHDAIGAPGVAVLVATTAVWLGQHTRTAYTAIRQPRRTR